MNSLRVTASLLEFHLKLLTFFLLILQIDVYRERMLFHGPVQPASSTNCSEKEAQNLPLPAGKRNLLPVLFFVSQEQCISSHGERETGFLSSISFLQMLHEREDLFIVRSNLSCEPHCTRRVNHWTESACSCVSLHVYLLFYDCLVVSRLSVSQSLFLVHLFTSSSSTALCLSLPLFLLSFLFPRLYIQLL